jgi:hypothetical protein
MHLLPARPFIGGTAFGILHWISITAVIGSRIAVIQTPCVLNLQFRAEIFNLLNRANFNTPNLIVFTPPTASNPTGVSGTAGAITSTSTTARQVQFALKLLW